MQPRLSAYLVCHGSVRVNQMLFNPRRESECEVQSDERDMLCPHR